MDKQFLRNAIQKYKDGEIGDKEMDFILNEWLEAICKGFKIKEMEENESFGECRDLSFSRGFNRAVGNLDRHLDKFIYENQIKKGKSN